MSNCNVSVAIFLQKLSRREKSRKFIKLLKLVIYENWSEFEKELPAKICHGRQKIFIRAGENSYQQDQKCFQIRQKIFQTHQ